jgi:hypothetical protein
MTTNTDTTNTETVQVTIHEDFEGGNAWHHSRGLVTSEGYLALSEQSDGALGDDELEPILAAWEERGAKVDRRNGWDGVFALVTVDRTDLNEFIGAISA